MRENTAYIRPPRALWVPFDLGRPFGAPNDAAFQMDVLRTVLALFERSDGPVILEDFDKDAPGQGAPENMEGMVCPIPLRKSDGSQQSDLVRDVLAEIDQLAPWQTLFRETHKRSTVGVGKLNLNETVHYLGELMVGGASKTVPTGDWGPALRFASEDLRNFYLEAASMRPGGSASHQELTNWFWGDTSAGALLLGLHPVCLASGNEDLRQVALRWLIPRAQQHRLQA